MHETPTTRKLRQAVAEAGAHATVAELDNPEVEGLTVKVIRFDSAAKAMAPLGTGEIAVGSGGGEKAKA